MVVVFVFVVGGEYFACAREMSKRRAVAVQTVGVWLVHVALRGLSVLHVTAARFKGGVLALRIVPGRKEAPTSRPLLPLLLSSNFNSNFIPTTSSIFPIVALQGAAFALLRNFRFLHYQARSAGGATRRLFTPPYKAAFEPPARARCVSLSLLRCALCFLYAYGH